ncbi:MAG: hypothetical protein IKS41_07270 [Alphaproteobacteria bacterium]|nr:hypothetical protein [Alphaproteobacteria bacterium]
MKRLFKHFFQTALLVALAWVIIMLPQDTWTTYINPIVWGLIVLILIVMGIYLYRGHKKGLFIFTGLMILCLSCPTFAYQQVTCTNETSVTLSKSSSECSSSTGCSYHTCMIDTYQNKADYCSLSKNFDIDEAVKNESKAPKKDDITYATKYIDSFERAEVAGCINFRTDGYNYKGQKQKKRRCAKAYLSKVSKYKNKKRELNTSTVYQIMKSDKDSCWPCGLVHVMMVAVEKLALSMEDELSKAALWLLGLMFLFWLLFKVFMLIGQFGTANNAEFFTDLLTRVVLAVMAVGLLNGPMGFVYRITFSSLLDVTVTLSSQIVAVSNSSSGLTSNSLSTINNVKGLGNKLVNNQNVSCECCTSESSDCNGGEISECKVNYTGTTSYAGTGFSDDEVKMLFSKKDKQALMCLTCKTYKETAPFVAAGRVLIYYAWKNKKLLSKAAEWVGGVIGDFVSSVPNPFSMWFIGMTLIVCFSWIGYVIAFKLLDIFLRIGFIIILTPFLITAFVFPISRQYTKRGWEFLAHALLSIFGVSIGIAIYMAALTASLPTSMVNKLKTVFTMTEVGEDQDYPQKLMDAIVGAEEGGGAFTAFLVILLLCFCGIKVLQASQVIVEGLSGITCGIPSIAGAAVVGAIRAALAPFRMAKNIIMDKIQPGKLGKAWKRAKKEDERKEAEKDNPDQPGFMSKIGGVTGTGIEKGGAAAGKAAGKTTEYTMKGVGYGVEGVGKANTALGKGLSKIPYVGAVIAAPFLVVGKTLEATGKTIRAVAPYVGQAVEKGVKAGARTAARGVKRGSRSAQRVWNRVKRRVINRIKQIPAKIKQKLSRKGRRDRAKKKYGRHKEGGSDRSSSGDKKEEKKSEEKPDKKPKPEERKKKTTDPKAYRRWLRTKNALDGAEDRIDESLDAAERSFGNDGNQVLPDTNSGDSKPDDE